MGEYLRIKEEEEDYIWEVAGMALAAPLPPGYKEVVMQGEGEGASGQYVVFK
jgi:hypothetical protein